MMLFHFLAIAQEYQTWYAGWQALSTFSLCDAQLYSSLQSLASQASRCDQGLMVVSLVAPLLLNTADNTPEVRFNKKLSEPH